MENVIISSLAFIFIQLISSFSSWKLYQYINLFLFFSCLPTHKEVFTVLTSPNVYKKAREKFKLCTHKRLIDIYANTSKVTDALAKIELASGVAISIKS